MAKVLNLLVLTFAPSMKDCFDTLTVILGFWFMFTLYVKIYFLNTIRIMNILFELKF